MSHPAWLSRSLGTPPPPAGAHISLISGPFLPISSQVNPHSPLSYTQQYPRSTISQSTEWGCLCSKCMPHLAKTVDKKRQLPFGGIGGRHCNLDLEHCVWPKAITLFRSGWEWDPIPMEALLRTIDKHTFSLFSPIFIASKSSFPTVACPPPPEELRRFYVSGD